MTNLLFINASDILFSFLFTLLQASITILLCFALAIPTGTPITVVKDLSK